MNDWKDRLTEEEKRHLRDADLETSEYEAFLTKTYRTIADLRRLVEAKDEALGPCTTIGETLYPPSVLLGIAQAAQDAFVLKEEVADA